MSCVVVFLSVLRSLFPLMFPLITVTGTLILLRKLSKKQVNLKKKNLLCVLAPPLWSNPGPVPEYMHQIA